jgi:hypothetical protein
MMAARKRAATPAADAAPKPPRKRRTARPKTPEPSLPEGGEVFPLGVAQLKDLVDVPEVIGELIPTVPDAWSTIEFSSGGKKHLAPLIDELFILTKERGVVRLGDVMNHAQRDFLTRCEAQLNKAGRIRACVLKARQIGLSTIIEAILFTLSVLYNNINSLVIAHEKDAAEALLLMTRRYWDTYIFHDFHDEKYAGRAQLSWSDTGSNLQIATAKNVNAGRSRTIHMLHASEVAFYDDPDTLMTGLRQSIPVRGLSAVFYESTANGVGNFFHRECVSSMKRQSEYEFFFYPWHEHPEYTAAYMPDEQQEKYAALDDLDEEEQKLRLMGINDARLIWRRYAIQNNCMGDVDKFHQEYPTTPHEAFVSTGRNVFPLENLLVHYVPKRGVRGILKRRGQQVVFVEDARGWLTVYSKPSRDLSWGVYAIGADPTHTIRGDNAVAQVLNRRTKEQVAVYTRKIDPVAFGKDLQLLGTWYHTAIVAPEREGPGGATIGCMAGDNYPNIYQGSNVTSAKGHVTDALGWSTNSVTKHLAVQHLKRLVTEPLVDMGGATYGLIIHHEQTLAEMRDFVTDEKGTGYENSGASAHDDHVMALGITVAVDNLEPAPPPYEATSPNSAVQRPIARVTEKDGKTMAEHPQTVAQADENDAGEGPVVPWETWGEAKDAWE